MTNKPAKLQTQELLQNMTIDQRMEALETRLEGLEEEIANCHSQHEANQIKLDGLFDRLAKLEGRRHG